MLTAIFESVTVASCVSMHIYDRNMAGQMMLQIYVIFRESYIKNFHCSCNDESSISDASETPQRPELYILVIFIL